MEIPDCHCHLSVDTNRAKVDELAARINSLGLPEKSLHIMTTYWVDLELMDVLLDQLTTASVMPYFGIHPWYSHLFTFELDDDEDFKKRHYNQVLQPGPSDELLANLPVPTNIHTHIKRMKDVIAKHEKKFGFGVGEIGLDKVIRVPMSGFLGSKIEVDGPKLSLSKVSMAHQMRVFEEFLHLAKELNKQVSVHCVKAHGLLYESVVKFPDVPTVILHSYSGSSDHAKMFIRHYKKASANLCFSFSNWINGVESKREVLESIASSLDAHNLLTESDLPLDDILVRLQSEYFDHLKQINLILADVAGDFDAKQNMIEATVRV